MNRRRFLQAALASGAVARYALAEAEANDDKPKFILSAPLTHSDWMLKPGVEWGEPGVRHMLDACKACGWSRVYWRVLDGGRSLYNSKLMRPQGKWDDDNFWSPQNDADRQLLQRFTPNMTAEQRTALSSKFAALD